MVCDMGGDPGAISPSWAVACQPKALTARGSVPREMKEKCPPWLGLVLVDAEVLDVVVVVVVVVVVDVDVDVAWLLLRSCYVVVKLFLSCC